MKKLLSICLALLLVAGLAVIPTGADTAAIAADTTWYDESKTEFVLEDEADLLGFAKLHAEGKTFAGMTILLARDMDLNPDFTASVSAAQPTNVWANAKGTAFAGVFDGQGHSVKGIYSLEPTTDGSGSGIFGLVAPGTSATIRNLILLNSIYRINRWQPGAIFGIVAGTATISNVYSEMELYSYFQPANGGYFAGYVTGTLIVDRSVVAATITSEKHKEMGGFAGFIAQDGNVTVTNRAFYGSLADSQNTTANSGFIDENRGTLTVKNCISAGTVAANSDGNVNSIVRNPKGIATQVGIYIAENNLYTEEKTAAASKEGATRVTSADLANFYTWNEANPDAGFSSWDVIDGKAYPTTLAWKVKGTNSEAVCLKNWQKTAVTGGKWAVRLLGGVDALDYEQLELRLTVRNTEGKTATWTEEIAKVYGSILADGETHTAASLETAYIWAVVLEDIPEAQTAVDLDAAVYTVKDGVKTLVSVHSILIGGAEQ